MEENTCVRGATSGGSERVNLMFSDVEYASSSIHVMSRECVPVPRAFGEAVYSPLPVVRLKPEVQMEGGREGGGEMKEGGKEVGREGGRLERKRESDGMRERGRE